MKVYHGTTIGKLGKLVSAIKEDRIRWPGLAVTNSPQLAARYANAQASGIVDPQATVLSQHGAIVSLEVPNPIWHYRPSFHNSLDLAEAFIEHASIISIEKHECNYPFCTCHSSS